MTYPRAAEVVELLEHRKLEITTARGWLATVQWGCDAALEYLRGVGYAV